MQIRRRDFNCLFGSACQVTISFCDAGVLRPGALEDAEMNSVFRGVNIGCTFPRHLKTKEVGGARVGQFVITVGTMGA